MTSGVITSRALSERQLSSKSVDVVPKSFTELIEPSDSCPISKWTPLSSSIMQDRSCNFAKRLPDGAVVALSGLTWQSAVGIPMIFNPIVNSPTVAKIPRIVLVRIFNLALECHLGFASLTLRPSALGQ